MATLIPALVDAGVDVVQLREKEAERTEILRAGAAVREACARAGIPFIVNDHPDIALTLGADGVHVGQDDAPVQEARAVVGEDAIVGLSTHSPAEIDAAVALGPLIDYIGVGPVEATPTKPGRPGTGLGLVAHAAAVAGDLPWFVTGGMSRATLPAALDAGARRVVVVRAITEADDPVAVAATLARMLAEVPL